MRLLPIVEHAVKGRVWDCRMCGQCVLHSTGMTCPMTCPKTLRNGPCGGVRADGHCEVDATMECVWVAAERRSRRMPARWREELNHLRPPVDNRLQGTASWTNLATGRDREVPLGWIGATSGASAAPAPSLAEVDDTDGLPAGFHVHRPLS